MTEAEALEKATAALHEAGLADQVSGLKSIRLSLASEVRTVLGIDDPDLSDTWYVSFALKREADVMYQHPDDVLFEVDDRSGVVTLVYQM